MTSVIYIRVQPISAPCHQCSRAEWCTCCSYRGLLIPTLFKTYFKWCYHYLWIWILNIHQFHLNIFIKTLMMKHNLSDFITKERKLNISCFALNPVTVMCPVTRKWLRPRMAVLLTLFIQFVTGVYFPVGGLQLSLAEEECGRDWGAGPGDATATGGEGGVSGKW